MTIACLHHGVSCDRLAIERRAQLGCATLRSEVDVLEAEAVFKSIRPFIVSFSALAQPLDGEFRIGRVDCLAVIAAHPDAVVCGRALLWRHRLIVARAARSGVPLGDGAGALSLRAEPYRTIACGERTLKGYRSRASFRRPQLFFRRISRVLFGERNLASKFRA